MLRSKVNFGMRLRNFCREKFNVMKNRLKMWLQQCNHALERKTVDEATDTPQLFPPGHFYSPIPSLTELQSKDAKLFGPPPTQVPGVNLNVAGQLELLETLATYYPDLPFPEEKSAGLRYYYQNDFYSYGDAIVLYAMIRHVQPKRIIEVGSGYSSCVMLDTNERFLQGQVALTFIEPYPEILNSVISINDNRQAAILTQRVEDVDLSVFRQLGPGDILFIDSTHVSRIGSDVNYLFFEVLPALQNGVYIHIHDIFYPFEYFKYWIYEGRQWNETYLLHAFLQYNFEFTIVYFATYLSYFFRERLEELMPLCLKNPGGNIWLEKHTPQLPAQA